MEVKRNIGIKWVNSLMTNVPHHMETSRLIYFANELAGFYMMRNTAR